MSSKKSASYPVAKSRSAPSLSSSPSKNAIPHPFTSLTKSTPISMPSTALRLPRCCSGSVAMVAKRVMEAVSSSVPRLGPRWCMWRIGAMVLVIRIRRVVLMSSRGRLHWSLLRACRRR
ncbi:hypothetical protein COCC4DRAFT_32621, partial [Bipolaris maydis ATCC 48331]